MRLVFAIVVLASACGRFNFGPFDPDSCALELTVPAESNLNSPVPLTTSGGAPPITFALSAGHGTITEGAQFFASERVGTATIAATDVNECTASATIVVRGRALFYLSGTDANSVPRPEIFRSDDGATWQTVGALPAARTLGRALVYDDRMWYLGGNGASEVWWTNDGVTWTAGQPLPMPMVEFGVAVYREKMWLVGGSSTGVNQDAVWASGGEGWSMIGKLPVAMHGTRCASYLDRLWCFGGHEAPGRFARVFSTDDGVSWRDEAPLPFIREEHGQAVLDDDLVVIIDGSDSVAGTNDGATTRDGVTWTVQGMTPDVRYITDLAVLDGKIYLAGASQTVLVSSDGSSWNVAGTLPVYRETGGFVAFTPH